MNLAVIPYGGTGPCIDSAGHDVTCDMKNTQYSEWFLIFDFFFVTSLIDQ